MRRERLSMRAVPAAGVAGFVAAGAVGGVVGGVGGVASAHPYDFTQATALLNAELPDLQNRVAVIVRQDGREIYRYQAGTIDYPSQTRLASFTKTLSAAVVLSVRDSGLITLNDRVGDTIALMNTRGIGNATILDCFGMRHGITTPIAFEIDTRFTLAESVNRIALTGTQSFTPGAALLYDGPGMQVVGRICEIETGVAWETLARQRIFDPCGMAAADFGQFAPNPAIAGGARSSADETIRFAQMVIDGGWTDGWNGGVRALSQASVDQLFTNSTFGLPVVGTPWPETDPLYPYGASPDYGFGTWIYAQRPDDGVVEQIIGAGAWGSYMWLDQRRGMVAVLITDVPAGSQASKDAALGLFAIATAQADAHQVGPIEAIATGAGDAPTQLAWEPVDGATAYRVYASEEPIRTTFDLRGASVVAQTSQNGAMVAPASFYAVTAVFGLHENLALTKDANTIEGPRCPACAADYDGNGGVDGGDLAAFFADFEAGAGCADVDANGGVDGGDLGAFFAAFEAGGC